MSVNPKLDPKPGGAMAGKPDFPVQLVRAPHAEARRTARTTAVACRQKLPESWTHGATEGRMLRIWGRTNSSNVQKVLWCCAELGLAYERIEAGAGAWASSIARNTGR